jgi:ankyrin repeat protein
MSDINSTEEKQSRAAEEQTRLDEVLREACREGRDSLVKHMLAKGAKPSARNKSGRTALMMATECEPETLKALLALCDVDAQDLDGWTALTLAAMRGHARAVELFLAAGADPNKSVDGGGGIALHLAVEQGSAACVALLAPKSDLDARDGEGRRAEDAAKENGRTESLAILREERAKREAQALRETVGASCGAAGAPRRPLAL